MIETTVAGSLPKPSWLAEPEKLWAPWRLEDASLIEGQQDAALAWIKIQEDASIDIVSDGEQFRKHFVHLFIFGFGRCILSHHHSIGVWRWMKRPGNLILIKNRI